MQKEPIPFISGPGALLFVNILAVVYYYSGNSLFSDNSHLLYISIAVLTIPPIYNLLFHSVWKLFYGYTSFGYQRFFTKTLGSTQSNRRAINVVFDKYIYGVTDSRLNSKAQSLDNGAQVEYARRRVASFLMYLQALVTAVIFSIVGVLLLLLLLNNCSAAKLLVGIIVLLVNILLVLVFLSMTKIISDRLYFFEKHYLEFWYDPKVADDIENDIKDFLKSNI